MENLFSSKEVPVMVPLLIGSLHHASRIGVTVQGGQGVLPRGAVLYKDEDGACKHAGAAQVTGGASPPMLYLLEDELNTGSDADAVFSAAVFQAGHFNRAALSFASSVNMATAETMLRMQGIFLAALAK